MEQLSVVIVCRNERRFLDLAIRSVLPIAAEVIVGDMHSTDGSPDVARTHGATVVDIEPHLLAEYVRPGLIQRAAHEWILLLDPDEMVSPELASEITRIIEAAEVDVVDLPFQTYMMGAAMRGSGWSTSAEHHIRLFRRGAVEMPAGVHAATVPVAGRAMRRVLPEAGVIHHFNYVSWDQFVTKMNRYTSIEAEERARRGTPPRLPRLALELCGEVGIRGVRERTWRDGWRGPALVALMCVYRGLVFLKSKQLADGGGEEQVVSDYRRLAERMLDVGMPRAARSAS